jgi:tellurite resistance protein TehA-like permease
MNITQTNLIPEVDYLTLSCNLIKDNFFSVFYKMILIWFLFEIIMLISEIYYKDKSERITKVLKNIYYALIPIFLAYVLDYAYIYHSVVVNFKLLWILFIIFIILNIIYIITTFKYTNTFPFLSRKDK